MELDGQAAAFDEFDCLSQRQIALALTVGFNLQSVVGAEDRSDDIAHVLRDVGLAVAAVDGAGVGVTVSCGNGDIHKKIPASVLMQGLWLMGVAGVF